MSVHKPLLACGIASSLLYVAMLALAPMRWQSYSAISQAVSELSAIDAPSRSLVLPIAFAYGVLLVAFGLGVWVSANGWWSLRVSAVCLIGSAIVGLLVPFFFPMHMRGAPISLTDTMHIVGTIVCVVLFLLSMGFAAVPLGAPFRAYSIATIVVLAVFGILGGQYAEAVQANRPTPWLGLEERINIYGYLLWVAVLAVVLMRMRKEQRS